jgi:hypothetical protein
MPSGQQQLIAAGNACLYRDQHSAERVDLCHLFRKANFSCPLAAPLSWPQWRFLPHSLSPDLQSPERNFAR